MDFDAITDLLRQHIQDQPSVDTGLSEIKGLLGQANEKIIAALDHERIQKEFAAWLTRTLRDEPIPANIEAIHFGLFTMAENNEELTTIYLCGSARTPLDDPDDWNIDPIYFPKYYLVLKDFRAINQAYPDLTGDQEVLIFNGLLNLLVINSIGDHLKDVLKYKRTIYIGTGYDAGDTYVIGQLTAAGLKNA